MKQHVEIIRLKAQLEVLEQVADRCGYWDDDDVPAIVDELIGSIKCRLSVLESQTGREDKTSLRSRIADVETVLHNNS